MTVLYWILGIVFSLLLLLFFLPFFFTIDTELKFLRVRWGLLVVVVDLSRKTTTITFAGIHFGGKRKKSAPSVSASRPEEATKPPPTEKPERGAKGGEISYVQLLLAHRSLAVTLIEETARYAVRLIRSFSVSQLRLDFSFDDPVINGICYGAIQGVYIKKVHLAVNFWSENRFIGRFWLPLYRTVVPTVSFLARLPHSEIYNVIKEIRRQSSAQEEVSV